MLHSADYVSGSAKWENFWSGEGWRIGRSAGCPAVSEDDIRQVLSRLPTGSFLYIYAGQQEQLPRDQRLHMLAGESSNAEGVPVKNQGSGERVRVR